MKWLSDNAVERLRLEVELPDLDNTKYRLIRKVGSGGMGTVYLAQDANLGRKVAVKIMNFSDQTGALAERMLREARIVALLEHPSIVPIHDVGTLPDGRVFYAMKLVQGTRLDQYSNNAEPISDRLRVFQKVCEAVAFAHARGVIHRDLKPENIMVGPFGEVLVMDWGVAKMLDGSAEVSTVETEDRPSGSLVSFDADQTKTLPLAPMGANGDTAGGIVIGTPAYMAPEQARGETSLVDERADVYALGAVLYFLLTGWPPVSGKDDSNERAPVRPRHINSKVPRSIEAVAMKAMSKQRSDRYFSAQEIADDVLRHLDGKPVSAYRENMFERTGRWSSQNRYILMLVLAYLIMRVIILLAVGS